MSTHPRPLTFRFAEFDFDAGAGDLRRHGQRVTIQEQPLIVLEMLLARAGSVVTRRELCERLWPDAFIDFDNGLNNAISRLRTALHDSAVRPRFVETLGRRGYRFIAPLERAGGTAPAPTVHAWLIGKSARVSLVSGENLLGRAGEGVIGLASSTVSRRHARITIGEEAFIEDLGSKNGTFVGGRRVRQPVKLGNGDSVRLGSLTLRFVLPQAGDETRTLSASD